MKDLQRCWMVKAILGNVERGSRMLEIGAGEPLVAGMLSRLGYDVTVVDPYDGSGNGPREFARFTAAYPDVDFVRDQFPPERGARRRLRLRLLDLGARARARSSAIDAVIERRPAAASPSAAAARSTRSTTWSPAGAPTSTARDSSGSSPPRASRGGAARRRSPRWSATRRPTSSPPRPTTAGAATCPTTQYPMRRIGSVELFAALSALRALGDPRRLAVEDPSRARRRRRRS